MGDVLDFSDKKPKKAKEPEVENIAAMVCGQCQNISFHLAVDGRLFCTECLGQVDAFWCMNEDNPVA
jgi:hypothetical protein